MAKITNKDNICRLNSVAELEIISLLTNSNCMKKPVQYWEKHIHTSPLLYIYIDVEIGVLLEENHTYYPTVGKSTPTTQIYVVEDH